MTFPKPRYEIREIAGRQRIWDTIGDGATMDRPSNYSEACRLCASLNREYQRWLTDRFYDRATFL